MNDIVQYDNALNGLKFKGFFPRDFDFMMAICSKARNKGTDKVVLGFDEIKQITNYTQTSTMVFVNDLLRMNKKLLDIFGTVEINGVYHQGSLFYHFVTDPESHTLTVSVNENFRFILNEITKNFTWFDLKEFTALESKYAKTLYRLLKQFKTTGLYRVEIVDFRELMGIPKSYTNRDVMSKVVKPGIEELKDHFQHLKCVPITAPKRGNPIVAYEFTFGKEIYEHQPKVEKKSAPTKKKNTFTDYNQRSYDYDELEKKLLGSQKEMPKEEVEGQTDVYDIFPECCPTEVQITAETEKEELPEEKKKGFFKRFSSKKD